MHDLRYMRLVTEEERLRWRKQAGDHTNSYFMSGGVNIDNKSKLVIILH